MTRKNIKKIKIFAVYLVGMIILSILICNFVYSYKESYIAVSFDRTNDEIIGMNIFTDNPYYTGSDEWLIYFGETYDYDEEQIYSCRLLNKDIKVIRKIENVMDDFRIDFDKDIRFVEIYKNNVKIMSEEINFCNYNHQCEPCAGKDCLGNETILLENYLTCPNDCESGKKDYYCDLVEDDICDPDCNDLDMDCELCKDMPRDEVISYDHKEGIANTNIKKDDEDDNNKEKLEYEEGLVYFDDDGNYVGDEEGYRYEEKIDKYIEDGNACYYDNLEYYCMYEYDGVKCNYGQVCLDDSKESYIELEDGTVCCIESYCVEVKEEKDYKSLNNNNNTYEQYDQNTDKEVVIYESNVMKQMLFLIIFIFVVIIIGMIILSRNLDKKTSILQERISKLFKDGMNYSRIKQHLIRRGHEEKEINHEIEMHYNQGKNN
ncbi:MAG: hypothetical protein ABIG89_06310 [Candidatus Woesearchaeota archaeon]